LAPVSPIMVIIENVIFFGGKGKKEMETNCWYIYI
jgi:hypothetical protein